MAAMATMEDTVGRSRLHSHPPSTPSKPTPRLTPRSSRSSSAQLPTRAMDESKSSLLQDRLREKKAESARAKRSASSFDGASRASSSPTRPERDPRFSASENGHSKKVMGVKEIEDTVSTLHKQNFDLKLELFHRRQRQTELEERIEAAEAQLNDQAEMQSINEQLLEELLKRDQAIEEAVGLICELEEKVERLERDQRIVRAFDAQYALDGGLQGAADGEEPGSETPRGRGSPRKSPDANDGRSIARMPSFLSDRSEGTDVLRSLYLPDRHTPLGLPVLPEEKPADETDASTMNSPRLSVLSESSFVSVYGRKVQSPASFSLDGESQPNDEADKPADGETAANVEKWVDERSAAMNLPRGRTYTPATEKFLSINNILQSPKRRLAKLESKLSQQSGLKSSTGETEKSFDLSSKFPSAKALDMQKCSEYAPPRHYLPPTPDTLSTSTLPRGRMSNDTLNVQMHRDASRTTTGSIPSDRPFLDEVTINSLQQRLFANAPSDASIIRRPRSAGETVTSRREGHGWETDTQSSAFGYTESNSAEMFGPDPWLSLVEPPTAVKISRPPDMFNFLSGSDGESEDEDLWSRTRSIAHQHLEARAPLRHSQSRIDRAKNDASRSRAAEPQQPADPVRMASQLAQIAPVPRPRRSSLGGPAIEKKRLSLVTVTPALREKEESSAPSNGGDAANARGEKEAHHKRGRITSMIFGLGRSETAPIQSQTTSPSRAVTRAPTGSPLPPPHFYLRPGQPSYADFDLESTGGATPPPIARYPGQTQSRGARPTTSSSLDGTLTDMSRPPIAAGAAQPAVYADANATANHGGGRKWFGLARGGRR